MTWIDRPVLDTWEQLELGEEEVQWLGTVRSLGPAMLERAAESDRLRQFPISNLEDLHHAGILSVAVPKEFGGGGAGIRLAALIIEEVARSCASTAWLLMTHYGFMFMLPSLLGDAAAPIFEEVVTSGAMAAGTTNITQLDARIVSNGYIINGHARFCAGSQYAKWVSIPANLPISDGHGSVGRVLWFDARREGVGTLDNWITMSLRATRSDDLILKDVRIFSDEVYPYSPDAPPLVSKVPRRYPGIWQSLFLQNPLFLGTCQGALDWVCDHVKSRGLRRDAAAGRSSSSLARLPGVQFAIADAISTVAAGRALLYARLNEIEKAADANRVIANIDWKGSAMALFLSRAVVDVTTELFRIPGGEAVMMRNPLERAFRDVQVARLADGNQPDRLRERLGKWVLDIPLDEEPRWV